MKPLKKGFSVFIIAVLTVAFLFALSGALAAQEEQSTILTAERTNETIIIDGYANEASWANTKKLVVRVQDGSIGNVDVILRALYDKDYIYIHGTWPDPTMSVDKKLWTFNGSEWLKSGDEDRFSIFWNIDDSVRGFNIGGCAMLCHGDRMHANFPDEKADSWHWKASRTDPAGYADDKFVDSTVVSYGTGPLGVPTEWTGRHSDAKISGSYKRNVNEDETGPRYYEPNPADPEDARFLFQTEIDNGEAVEISSQTEFKKGGTVPGYIVERPTGSRGDIEAKGVWKNDVWSLELKRKLNTGNEDDVQFDVAKTYRFGIAVMDNTGGFEAFGKGHSFDLGAKTLEFGGTGSEAVTQLALIRDYLVTAEEYIEEGNPGLAISTITDARTLYTTIRREMADADPSLHIEITNRFESARRNPTLETITGLMQNIDDAALTIQGKREPTNPTLGLIILSVWGEIQIYVFILLSILVLYPLYRTARTARIPELRSFGLFLFIIILPVFFEGLGRAGILLDIQILQNFSFTTNEYATLLWALGMSLALLIARFGFNEVDSTIKSLRTRTDELLKANKLKDIFTDIMRHDLLNPAGLSRGMAEVALEDEEDPDKKEILQTIFESNERMIDLIKSASTFAELEFGEKLEFNESDLGAILRNAAMEMAPLADEKKVKIKITAEGEFPALINPLIHDVFSNLMSNAIKYGPENVAVVAGIEDEGANWKIFVADNGPGIPDEDKEAIFDRFKRLEKGAVKGTGLGLAIVKRVAEAHKGRVWVEDNPKGGSIFYVTLPKDSQ